MTEEMYGSGARSPRRKEEALTDVMKSMLA